MERQRIQQSRKTNASNGCAAKADRSAKSIEPKHEFNPKSAFHKLVSSLGKSDAGKASKASAKQRQGRAGRVGPGLCFRMYPRDWWDNSQVPTQGVSELQRSPLERLVLQTLVLGLGAQETSFLCHCLLKRRLFAKTGSGQAQETVE